jgi:hypothetical protein
MTGLRDRLSIRRKVKMSDEQREKRQGIMDENGGCIEHIGKGDICTVPRRAPGVANYLEWNASAMFVVVRQASELQTLSEEEKIQSEPRPLDEAQLRQIHRMHCAWAQARV